MTEPLVLAVDFRSGKAEGVAAKPLRTRGDGENRLDRLLLEDTHAVVAYTEVHEHLVELVLVVRRRPEARAGGRKHVTVVVRALLLVVLKAPLRGRALLAVVHLDLRLQLLVGRPEPGALHAEGIEDLLLEVVLPLHAGHDLDNRRADVDAGVGVLHLRAGLEEKRRSGRNSGVLPERCAARPAAALDVGPLGARLEREAARVVEAHAHGEDVLRLDERLDAVGLASVYPESRELGKVFGDGIVEADLPLLDELRDRHAAEAFRLGALHVDVVGGDLALRGDICVAEARRLGHAVAVEHAHHAGELALLDIRGKRIGHICCPRVLDSVAGMRAATDHRHRGDESNHQFLHFLFLCCVFVLLEKGFMTLYQKTPAQTTRSGPRTMACRRGNCGVYLPWYENRERMF